MSARSVSIHLTPFAPGVSAAAIGDRRRWITQWSVTPAQSLGDLVTRLERRAGSLAVRTAPDAVEIIGRVDGYSDPQPLALIAYGLSAPECENALRDLANGVRPRRLAA